MATSYEDVTLITLNCRGLRSRASQDLLFSWLNCAKLDIVCLQETQSFGRGVFYLVG